MLICVPVLCSRPQSVTGILFRCFLPPTAWRGVIQNVFRDLRTPHDTLATHDLVVVVNVVVVERTIFKTRIQ